MVNRELHLGECVARWLVSIALFLVFSCVVFSQARKDTFELQGTVKTSGGGVVPATKVTAVDAKGQKYSSDSARNGSYRIQLVKGVYEIQFEREGFKRLIVSNLEIPLLKSDKLDVKLEPGRCSDCNGELYGERWDDFTVLTGTVFDQAGAVIPKVIIKAQGDDGVERTAKSDDEGNFEIRVHIGQNRLRFESAGFETLVFEKYRTARSYKEKMVLDVVLLGSTAHEPCGYGGDGCLNANPSRQKATKPQSN